MWTRRWFKCVKAVIALGIVASAAHFADNAIEIATYPEPAWITPIGIGATWIGLSAIACTALLRRTPDALFFLCAAVYALTLIAGLAHYFFGSPLRMPTRSNATVLSEALAGMALATLLLLRATATRT